jgi:hypothetical protein
MRRARGRSKNRGLGASGLRRIQMCKQARGGHSVNHIFLPSMFGSGPEVMLIETTSSLSLMNSRGGNLFFSEMACSEVSP